MDELKGKALNLKDEIAYADGAVISKILLKKDTGNITLFSFDKGQGLSEHTSPFDAVAQVVARSSLMANSKPCRKVK